MIFKIPPNDFHYKVEVVSCFCEWQAKILLLCRQDQKQYGNTWGPPAGKVAEGETPELAMARELYEESGIRVEAGKLNYFDKFYVRYPEYDFLFHIFQTSFKRLPRISIRTEEHKSHLWTLPKKALDLKLIRDEDEFIKHFYRF